MKKKLGRPSKLSLAAKKRWQSLRLKNLENQHHFKLKLNKRQFSIPKSVSTIEIEGQELTVS